MQLNQTDKTLLIKFGKANNLIADNTDTFVNQFTVKIEKHYNQGYDYSNIDQDFLDAQLVDKFVHPPYMDMVDKLDFLDRYFHC